MPYCIRRLILSLSLSLSLFLPPLPPSFLSLSLSLLLTPLPSSSNRSFLSSRALTKATVASSTFDSGTLVSGWTLLSTIYSRLTMASSSSSILPTRTSSGVLFLRRPTPSKTMNGDPMYLHWGPNCQTPANNIISSCNVNYTIP